MLVKPYQFETRENCSGNVKEDYRDERETSNAAEDSEINLEAILSILKIYCNSK